MPKVSVIVPVYNAEKYLRDCIDSIVRQSYDDFEIILVDDGAKDSSPAICDEYAKDHGNIRVIHKENEGVSIARKTGLDSAAGEYVMFVDSDDMITEGCLASVMTHMKKHGADIAAFNPVGAYSDERMKPFALEYRGLYDRERLRREVFPKLIRSIDDKYYRQALWGNLFRKEAISPYMIADRRATVGEDGACLIPAIFHADSMYFCGGEFYGYRIHEDSITMSHRAFDWDNAEVTSDHIAKHVDMSYGDLSAQLNRRICHDVFNICLSQAYSYDNSRDYCARVNRELFRPAYRNAIWKAKFRRNPLATAMQFTLMNKYYGIIYYYARTR